MDTAPEIMKNFSYPQKVTQVFQRQAYWHT